MYNLSDPDQVWECNNGGQLSELPNLKVASKLTETFILRTNPAKDLVFIDVPVISTAYEIKLMDISGKLLQQLFTPAYTTSVELMVDDLAQGMYLVELRNGKSSHTQKLVVR